MNPLPLHMNEEDLRRMNKVLRHRLRNSASGLKSSVSFLFKGLADRLTPQEKEYLPLILNECDALTHLTNRLQLAFDTPPSSPETSVGEALDWAVASVQADFPTALMRMEGASPSVRLLRDAVAIPLRELLSNALEATPNRGVCLSAQSDGAILTISVADEGAGADPLLFPIPLPFSTTKPRHLGLGLFIAARHLGIVGGHMEQAKTEAAHIIRLVYPLPPPPS